MPGVAVWKSTTLRRSGKTPWQARQAIKLWLADRHPLVCSDALQVVSELVNNVIEHVPAGPQRDWVKVRLGFGDGFVRLEVVDPGTCDPQPRFATLQQGSMDVSGRGLGIVAALSVRSGTDLLERGRRVVWADLTTAQRSDSGAVGDADR
ncbi:ATP-binding protein [Nonomuraea fuscirosea]